MIGLLLICRFSSLFSDPELKIAAAIHPKFRLSWIRDEAEKSIVASLVKERLLAMDGKEPEPEPELVVLNPTGETLKKKASIFDRFKNTKRTKTALEQEISYFFAQDEEDVLASLRHKTMRLLFLKANTALPSSAVIERICSLGGRVFVPTRSNLSDDHFEHLVVLRAN